MTTPYTTPNTTFPPPIPNNVQDLDHMAKMTRHLNYAILLQIMCFVAICVISPKVNSEGSLISPILGLLFFGVIIYAVVSVFRLMKSVSGTSTAIGLMIVMILPIPFLNIIIILYANGKASKILKASGYKIGLLGAKKAA